MRATNPTGAALLLFNDNETASQQVVVALSGKSSVQREHHHYDEAIYDLSGSATGTPPDPSGTSTWLRQLLTAWARRPCL